MPEMQREELKATAERPEIMVLEYDNGFIMVHSGGRQTRSLSFTKAEAKWLSKALAKIVKG